MVQAVGNLGVGGTRMLFNNEMQGLGRMLRKSDSGFRIAESNAYAANILRP